MISSNILFLDSTVPGDSAKILALFFENSEVVKDFHYA